MEYRKLILCSASTLLLSCLAPGCDSEGESPSAAQRAPDNDARTLPDVGVSGQSFKLQGKVLNAEGRKVPEEGLRVAVVWMGGSDRFAVAADVAIQGELPAAFSLLLSGPPPAAAISDRFGRRVAIGNVVVYADANSTGKLELPKDYDDETGDPILGVESTYSVFYLEGEPLVLAGDVTIPAGFSQVASTTWEEAHGCIESAPGEEGGCLVELDANDDSVRDLSAALDIPLSAAVKLPPASCRELDLSLLPGGSRTAHDKVTCYADGSYLVTQSFGPLADFCWGDLITSQKVAFSASNVVCNRCLTELGVIEFNGEDFAFDPATSVYDAGGECRPFDAPVLKPFEPAPDVVTTNDPVTAASSKLVGQWIGRTENPRPPPSLVNVVFDGNGRYQGSLTSLSSGSGGIFGSQDSTGRYQLLASGTTGISGNIVPTIGYPVDLTIAQLRFDASGNRVQFRVFTGDAPVPVTYDLFRVCADQ